MRILQEFSWGLSHKCFGTFRIFSGEKARLFAFFRFFSDKKALVNYVRIKQGKIMNHKLKETESDGLPIDKRPLKLETARDVY